MKYACITGGRKSYTPRGHGTRTLFVVFDFWYARLRQGFISINQWIFFDLVISDLVEAEKTAEAPGVL